MKTHRRIIIISLVISILSFIAILFFNEKSKIFQIFMGLMGSSIVTFFIEIPNYISIKEENENKLYYSLLNIKIQIIVLESSINRLVNSNSIISEKICDRIIQIIALYLNNLNSFDRDYYILKNKKYCIQEKIIKINNIFSKFEQTSYIFDSAYLEKRIEVIKKNKIDRNIVANEMKNELNILITACNDFYKVVDEIGNVCLIDRLINQWKIDELNLKKEKDKLCYNNIG